MKTMFPRIGAGIVFFLLSAIFVQAQTTGFTFQGRLTDGASAASGSYEMEFKLYDALSGGSQQGSTVSNPTVSVANGTFTVQLDFGSSPFSAGADRWVEVSVRKATDPPGFTVLTPRQQVTSAPYSIRSLSAASADNATNATNATTAGNVSGVVAVANGGTGSATGDGSGLNNLNASNLASGTVPTARLGSGTANSTTYLRGDNSWQTISSGGVTGSGTLNYIPKFTPATGSNIGNSTIQDNGTSISFGLTTPNVLYQGYFYRQQLTAAGDGQHTLFGYRTRDSQNDGTAYGYTTSNSGSSGYTFWGDFYTFGTTGFTYGDYARTGGVMGADQSGTVAWGSLGYKNSGSVWYGVYGSAAYASGGGRPSPSGSSEKQGIGGGFFGGMVGSFSRGAVIGQVTSGDVFANYNLGNVFTSGYSADMVSLDGRAGAERVAAYAVTSPELKVYDNGSALLSGSDIYVPFSSSYSGMLSSAPDVTVSPVGSPAQLYIKSIDKAGFTVAVAAGEARVKFSWIAVGSRVDSSSVAPPPADLKSGTFDSQLKETLFDDGDTTRSGKPMWWDGSKVRFDTAPEAPRPAKVEPKP